MLQEQSKLEIGSQAVSNCTPDIQPTTSSQNRKPFYRPRRYSRSDFPSCEFSTTLKTEDRYLKVELVNLSEYGARILTDDKINLIHHEQNVSELAITINNENIFNGKVKIKNSQQKEDAIEYGIAFLGQTLKFDQILRLQQETQLKEHFTSFLSKGSYVDRIVPEFKVALSDFRYFLEDMKTALTEEEENIKQLPSGQRETAQKRLMDFSEQTLKERVHSLIWKMYHVLKLQSKDDYPLYKQYFQKQLLSLTNDSMLFKRSMEKPRGYSGDFVMMDIIYRNQRMGNSLWERLINSALTTIPPGQALVNRIEYLLEQIKSTLPNEKEGSLRLLSVASGPCEEVRRLLCETPHLARPVEFHFIDQDEESLEFAQRNLYAITHSDGSSNATCYFINDKVKNFIKDPDNYKKYPKFDLIYSAGLFDYLPEPVAKQLIDTLYKMLDTNGVLIVGNASMENHFHFFIEFAGEWYLIHRSKEDLLKLVPAEVSQDKVSVDTEDTGVVHFLKIRK